MFFPLDCNTVPENWPIRVNIGLTYLITAFTKTGNVFEHLANLLITGKPLKKAQFKKRKDGLFIYNLFTYVQYLHMSRLLYEYSKM